MRAEVMVAMTAEEGDSMVHEEEVATDVMDAEIDVVVEEATIVAEMIGGVRYEAKNY
jgi:hypothetical protein